MTTGSILSHNFKVLTESLSIVRRALLDNLSWKFLSFSRKGTKKVRKRSSLCWRRHRLCLILLFAIILWPHVSDILRLRFAGIYEIFTLELASAFMREFAFIQYST